jgi:hypothetical protein
LSVPPWSIVAACQRFHAHGIRRAEGDVCARRDAVAPRLGSDRVQREVVARAASEQDVCIALELTLAQHSESEFG